MIGFWLKMAHRRLTQTTAAMVAASLFFTFAAAPFAQASFWEERGRESRRRQEPLEVASARVTGLAAPAASLSDEIQNIKGELLSGSKGGIHFSPRALDAMVGKFNARRAQEKDAGKVPAWLWRKVNGFGEIARAHIPQGEAIRLEAGRIRAERPCIIQVQDAHDIYSVQRNLVYLLNEMMHSGVELIGLEGSEGTLEGIETWRQYPDRESLLETAGYLLQNGLLTGPEVAGLSRTEENVEFFGLEEKASYLEQVRSFKDSLGNGEKVRGWCAETEARLRGLKEKIYPAPLKEIESEKARLEKGETKLGGWLLFLAGKERPAAALPERFPAVSQYLKAHEIERKIDFGRIGGDQRQLLSGLSRKLGEKEMAELLEESILHRLGKISYAEFYGALKEHCRAAGVTLTPGLSAYVDYISLVDVIDSSALFEEAARLEENAWQHTLAGAGQDASRLHEIDRDYQLLKKGLDFSLSPGEWTRFDAREPELAAIETRLASLDGGKNTVSFDGVAGRETLSRIQRFNELSEERNRIFVRKLSARMKEKGTNVAVLVAGGYHSAGLQKIFESQGFSYITVKPRMKVEEVGQDYHPLHAFTREPLPLEKLFMPEKLSIIRSQTLGSAAAFGFNVVAGAAWRTLATVAPVLGLSRKGADAGTISAFICTSVPEGADFEIRNVQILGDLFRAEVTLAGRNFHVYVTGAKNLAAQMQKDPQAAIAALGFKADKLVVGEVRNPITGAGTKTFVIAQPAPNKAVAFAAGIWGKVWTLASNLLSSPNPSHKPARVSVFGILLVIAAVALHQPMWFALPVLGLAMNFPDRHPGRQGDHPDDLTEDQMAVVREAGNLTLQTLGVDGIARIVGSFSFRRARKRSDLDILIHIFSKDEDIPEQEKFQTTFERILPLVAARRGVTLEFVPRISLQPEYHSLAPNENFFQRLGTIYHEWSHTLVAPFVGVVAVPHPLQSRDGGYTFPRTWTGKTIGLKRDAFIAAAGIYMPVPILITAAAAWFAPILLSFAHQLGGNPAAAVAFVLYAAVWLTFVLVPTAINWAGNWQMRKDSDSDYYRIRMRLRGDDYMLGEPWRSIYYRGETRKYWDKKAFELEMMLIDADLGWDAPTDLELEQLYERALAMIAREIKFIEHFMGTDPKAPPRMEKALAAQKQVQDLLSYLREHRDEMEKEAREYGNTPLSLIKGKTGMILAPFWESPLLALIVAGTSALASLHGAPWLLSVLDGPSNPALPGIASIFFYLFLQPILNFFVGHLFYRTLHYWIYRDSITPDDAIHFMPGLAAGLSSLASFVTAVFLFSQQVFSGSPDPQFVLNWSVTAYAVTHLIVHILYDWSIVLTNSNETPMSLVHPRSSTTGLAGGDGLLKSLSRLGQVPGYDDASRDTTELERYVRDYGIGRVTINTNWVRNVIAKGEYDDLIQKGEEEGLSAEEVFENIAVDLTGRIAGVLRSVYGRSRGVDGIASLQLSPPTYHSAEAMLAEARRLQKQLPSNVDFKVPATEEGLRAVELMLAEGIRVNVTCLFPDAAFAQGEKDYHAPQFEEAFRAYVRGLQEFVNRNRHLTPAELRMGLRRLSSVISVWVRMVDEIAQEDLPDDLKWKYGVAQAKIVAEINRRLLDSPEFKALSELGALPPRILWANNRTKSGTPLAPDHYIAPLVGEGTLSTMVPETLEFLSRHGQPISRLYDAAELDEAKKAIKKIDTALRKKGSSAGEVRRKAVEKSVAGFVQGFQDAVNHIRFAFAAQKLSPQILAAIGGEGGIVSLDGPSGVGKSALTSHLRHVLGALRPATRVVVIDLDAFLIARERRYALMKHALGDPLTKEEAALLSEAERRSISAGSPFLRERELFWKNDEIGGTLSEIRHFLDSSGQETLKIGREEIRKGDIILVVGKYANHEDHRAFYDLSTRIEDQPQQVRQQYLYGGRPRNPEELSILTRFYDLGILPSWKNYADNNEAGAKLNLETGELEMDSVNYSRAGHWPLPAPSILRGFSLIREATVNAALAVVKGGHVGKVSDELFRASKNRNKEISKPAKELISKIKAEADAAAFNSILATITRYGAAVWFFNSEGKGRDGVQQSFGGGDYVGGTGWKKIVVSMMRLLRVVKFSVFLALVVSADVIEGTTPTALNRPVFSGGTSVMVSGPGVQRAGKTPDVYADMVATKIPKSKVRGFSPIDMNGDTMKNLLRIAQANEIGLSQMEVVIIGRPREKTRLLKMLPNLDPARIEEAVQADTTNEMYLLEDPVTHLLVRVIPDGTFVPAVMAGLGLPFTKGRHPVLYGSSGSAEAMMNLQVLAGFASEGAVCSLRIMSKRIKDTETKAGAYTFSKDEILGNKDERGLLQLRPWDWWRLILGRKLFTFRDVRGDIDASIALITENPALEKPGVSIAEGKSEVVGLRIRTIARKGHVWFEKHKLNEEEILSPSAAADKMAKELGAPDARAGKGEADTARASATRASLVKQLNRTIGNIGSAGGALQGTEANAAMTLLGELSVLDENSTDKIQPLIKRLLGVKNIEILAPAPVRLLDGFEVMARRIRVTQDDSRFGRTLNSLRALFGDAGPDAARRAELTAAYERGYALALRATLPEERRTANTPTEMREVKVGKDGSRVLDVSNPGAVSGTLVLLARQILEAAPEEGSAVVLTANSQKALKDARRLLAKAVGTGELAALEKSGRFQFLLDESGDGRIHVDFLYRTLQKQGRSNPILILTDDPTRIADDLIRGARIEILKLINATQGVAVRSMNQILEEVKNIQLFAVQQ